MKDFLSTKLGKLVAAIALLGLVFLVILWWLKMWPWAGPILLALLVTAFLWVLIDFSLRALHKRRQEKFDAGVAAREGIDDRRREWIGWTAELRKQGIDRYALPMYLLVGEPQSGKSVMLQNSDLHFPFGQNRLSGIGGTRGCDWWFTEEAVILDLAGRLFTHEGGASDEAEWGAFLELLSEFRPLCPANGVILVLPCDGLLKDSDVVSGAKAGRMQAALLTLTQRIQARLPVYVVLTKADKVFGFAECVHRLDAAKRHEMFGWSRPADKVQAPFDVAEAQQAFEAMVERARLLRAQMLASARIPEALPEVDRMYAFPNEMAALGPALSLYLQRIFSESQLVDKLFFRGLYLTSGLQSGAPIAKVCAELMGGAGEADRRNLEALFTKQRAFFIKDLVRKRIFTEKGLVQPTRTRVVRARRSAIIGYGLAAAIAVLSVAGAALYLAEATRRAEIPEYMTALKSAKRVIQGEPSTPDVLAALSDVDAAARYSEGGAGGAMETVFRSSSDRFKKLYGRVFDRKLLPRLRTRAQENYASAPDPVDFKGFRDAEADARFLLSEIDLGQEADRRHFVGLVGTLSAPEAAPAPAEEGGEDPAAPADLEAEPAADGGTDDLLRRRIENSGTIPVLPAPSRAEIDALAARARRLWDGVLAPGSRWQVLGQLGYVLACQGLADAHDAIRRLRPDDASADVYELCSRLVSSMEVIGLSESDLPGERDARQLGEGKVRELLDELEKDRGELLRRLGEDPADAAGGASWKEAGNVRAIIETMFKSAPKPGNSLKEKAKEALLGRGRVITVPPKLVKDVREDKALLEVSDRGFLPDGSPSADSRWEPKLLAAQVNAHLATAKKLDTPAQRVLKAKLLRVQATYLARYTDWRPLRQDLARDPESEKAFSAEVSEQLTKLRSDLKAMEDPTLQDWISRLEELLARYEDEMLARWLQEDTKTLEMADELRRHLGLVEGAGGLDTSEHVAWSDRVDACLEERILLQRNARREYWDKQVPAFAGSIRDSAEEFLRLTGSSALEQKIKGAPGSDDDLDKIPPSILGALARSKKALDELKKLSKPGSGARLSGDPYVVSVQATVRAYAEDAALAGDGPAMAVRLAGSKAAGGVKPPPHVGGYYVERLFGAFHERVLKDVRALFVADLDRRIGESGQYRDLIGALWGDARADAQSVADQAGAFFDRDGALDRLLASYRIRPEKAAVPGEAPPKPGESKDWSFAEFRPARGTADSEAWDAVEFLVKLQGCLLEADDAKKRVSGAKVKVAIQCDTKSASSLWSKKPFFYGPDGTNGEVRYSVVGDKMGAFTLTWDFEPGPAKGLRMRWSDEADQGNKLVAGDYELKIPGPFAPMVLAWESDRHEDGRWKVSKKPAGSTLPATFTLSFLPVDLPERPRAKPVLPR